MFIDDNNLNRRVAFWDNWRYALSQSIKQFDADSAGKFIDTEDKISLLPVRKRLEEAYVLALKRFHGVLGDQINAIDASEHQEVQSWQAVN